MATSANTHSAAIAVIGMACRLPGATTPRAFWENLRNGVESIAFPSEQELLERGVPRALLADPCYVRATSPLDGIDQFDAAFFGFSPREARLLDPQQRLFLECAWEALEDAGHGADVPAKRVGVYAGAFVNTYMPGYARNLANLAHGVLQEFLHNANDFIATRTSYKLNLRGPSLTVQTACSTSLVAVHLACQSLLTGECDFALAGGASIKIADWPGYYYQEGGIASPDGHCRAFDAKAQGTFAGNGVGAVVLRRLEDAIADRDHVYAVIRGSAINNDGASKVGYTAPSIEGQAAVIIEALEMADVEARSIDYVEAQGTATALGDPMEIAALTQAFRSHTADCGFCGVGSVKANIGHLDAAAGIASFIKVVLSLQAGELPPLLHFQTPNPNIDFKSSPFYIETQRKAWERGSTPRRAGINAYGMGGTNAHVIVEEAAQEEREQSVCERPLHVLTLSAKSERALIALADRMGDALKAGSRPLADVCFTSNVGRAQWIHRLAVWGASSSQMASQLTEVARGVVPQGVRVGKAAPVAPKVAFLFTGQGSHYRSMGLELYASQPVFRSALDECDAVLKALWGQSLLKVLESSGDAESLLDATEYAQPALFALEYGLAALWRSWGVEPSLVLGHGVGECVAACMAGVMSVADGQRLVAHRARLMQRAPGRGGMATVFAEESQVARALSGQGEVVIAGVNGPQECVLAGELTALERVLSALEREHVRCTRLTASHAFHSPMMEPVLDAFEREARRVKFMPARIPLVSCVSGGLAGSEVSTAEYWRRHIREPVRFASAAAALRTQGVELVLEIGPHPVLLEVAEQTVPDGVKAWLPSLRSGRGEWESLLESVGEAYTHGVEVDWSSFDRPYVRRRVPLPTYPFERQRYWIEPSSGRDDEGPGRKRRGASATGHPLVGRRVQSPYLKESVYESTFNAADLPFLSDHVIFGVLAWPAAAHLELARATAQQELGAGPFEVVEFALHRHLLFTDNGECTVQFVIAHGENAARSFELFALEGGAEGASRWQLVASGKLREAAVEARAEDCVDRREIALRCPEEVHGSDYYVATAELGAELGERFQGIEKLWRRDGEVIAELCLPARLVEESQPYGTHPAILDFAFQSFGAAMPTNGTPWSQREKTGLYLPIAIDTFRMTNHRPVGQFFSHATLHEGADWNAEVVRGDIRLFDGAGCLVAEFLGLTAKRASRDAVPVEWEAFARTRPAGRSAPQPLAPTRRDDAAAKISLRNRLAHAPAAMRLEILTALVVDEVCRAMGVEASSVPAEQPLKGLGLDSLTAVELRSRLSQLVEMALPTTLIFDYPTPRAIANLLLEKLDFGVPRVWSDAQIRRKWSQIAVSTLRNLGWVDVLMQQPDDPPPSDLPEYQDEMIDSMDRASVLRALDGILEDVR